MGVWLDCNGFVSPYDNLNGTSWLRNATWRGLLRDIARAGYRPGQFSGLSHLWLLCGIGARSLSVMTYVRQQQGTLHARADTLALLDRTERAQISYHLGMGLAVCAAQQVLGVPWLEHADPLIESGVVKLAGGTRQRGDMLGLDAGGRWHVVEAKGRSHPVRQSEIRNAKLQASRIQSVLGVAPDTRCASVSDLSVTPFRVHFNDPEDSDGIEPTAYEADPLLVLRWHYAVIRDLHDAGVAFGSTMVGDVPVRLSTGMGLPFRLGLHEELFDSVVGDGDLASLLNFALGWRGTWHSLEQEPNADIGLDGLVIVGDAPDEG